MQNDQGTIFKGIYEFEDSSGSLVAAKLPVTGTADLYSGTIIIVKPNQVALFIYQGQIAEILPPGNHQVKTGNFPILTRLANWQFDFESPLRCEIWFFSTSVFIGRRWGTPDPMICGFSGMPSVPVRGHGIYNVVLKDPKKFYLNLMGAKTSFYDISEVEDLVQSQIAQFLPKSLSEVPDLASLNKSQGEISKELVPQVNQGLEPYGLALESLQIISLVPSQEVLEALDAKVALNTIGNQREYLLYKAANSLDAHGIGGNGGKETISGDSMQLMMGLMLGQSFMGLDFRQKEKNMGPAGEETAERWKACPKCTTPVKLGDKFCSTCGGEIK